MMWIFKSKETVPDIDCKLDDYAQWLRAQRPPFPWFMGQTSLVKEALAREGDDYISRCIAEGGVVAEDAPDTEESAVTKMAYDMVMKRLGHQQPQPVAPAPISMAGLGDRRKAKEEERRDPPPTFLGRKADATEAQG